MELYQDGQLSDDALEHYGVKGMKWGVRRSNKQLKAAAKAREKEDKKIAKIAKSEPVTRTSVGGKEGDDNVTVYSTPKRGVIATRDGAAGRISDDAVMASAIQHVARTNSISALSNQDLEVVTKRLNLEVNYNSAMSKRYPAKQKNPLVKAMQDAGKKFIQDEMKDIRSGKPGVVKPFLKNAKSASRSAAKARNRRKSAAAAAPVLAKVAGDVVKSTVVKN